MLFFFFPVYHCSLGSFQSQTKSCFFDLLLRTLFPRSDGPASRSYLFLFLVFPLCQCKKSWTDFPFFPGLRASILVLACRPASWGWSQKCAAPTVCLPHGVEDGSILHNAEQLVGRGHVVRYGSLPIAEESVRCPDLADHQVIEPQDLNGALELKSLVDPGLAEEHVHSVLLSGERETGGVGCLS